MANQFTSTTFSDTYKDDFKDSAGYHKVLFNSGRALQGRELNQLQTILQTQITRMADNIFMDGAAISPKSSGAGTDIVDFVKVDELTDTLTDYIGATFKGPASSGSNGLLFQVIHVTPEENGDYATLFGRYVSSNQDQSVSSDVQTTAPVFGKGDTLVDEESSLVSLSVVNQPLVESTGKGVLFSMQQAEFYVQGHFVFAPKQILAISKYDQYVDAEVGFEIVQDVVTTEDDTNLYDNQGARPNLSSPGADRYRIRMVLTTRDIIEDEKDFCTFATVRGSKIVQIKEGTDNFNQVEKRMAIRHHDTHGNFIVNDFEINFREGDDSANIILEVPAEQLGVRPLAFLDGYRLDHKIPVSVNLPKPVSTRTLEDESINAEYRNYVSFRDSSGTGNLGHLNPSNINTQTKLALEDAAGTVIGNARIKSLTNRDLAGTGDSDAYRMYLYDIKMKGSNNFRNVRGIREHNDTTSTPVKPSLRGGVGQDKGQLYVTDPNINSSLFRIPGGRVKSITINDLIVQRQANDTSDGTGQLQITVGTGESLVDEGQWLFINKQTNLIEDVSTSNIAIVGTTATITGLTASDPFSIYYYVKLNNPSPKSKTYREAWFDAPRNSALDSDGDGFVVPSLYDGYKLLEAYDSDSDGTVLTNKVRFDDGQRDNYYGPVVLRPDAGVSKDVTNIRCKVAYFEHGVTGDFFSVNSYDIEDSTWFDYGDIPVYTSKQSGEEFVLHNFLDFRPHLDPYADNESSSDRFDLPRDGDAITYDVEFYNSRVDQLVLTYDDQYQPRLIVNQGKEAEQPVPPNEKPNQMVLFDILLNGNTKSVEDIATNRRTYRSYKMTDINEVEQRVSRLEETVSLSFLEQEAANLIELDNDGIVRSKTGFFVDDFTKGYALTASTINNNFIDDDAFATSSLEDELFNIQSKLAAENIAFIYDSANNSVYNARTGVSKTNVVRKGETLMLAYTDVLDPTMKQEIISWKPGQSNEEHGYYNVNPFNVFMGEGTLRLNPSRDVWFDTVRLPDRHIQGRTIIRRIGEPLIPRTFTFTRTSIRLRWVPRPPNRFNQLLGSVRQAQGREVNFFGQSGTFETERTTQTFRVTQTVRTNIVSDQTFTRSLGDRTVAVISVPWMRQRRIMAKGEGLRPNTRYWCYFNGIRMDQWTRKRTETEFVTGINNGIHRTPIAPRNVSLIRHPDVSTPATEQQLITDANGEVFFELWIPNNANVPVPRSGIFGATEEWKTWIQESRRYTRQYGSSKSATLFDRVGWKFRCGSARVQLLDVSSYAPNSALSRASTSYASWGRINQVQRTLLSTRVITVQDELIERTDLIGTDVGGDFWQNWRPRDPLAQTFTVDGGEGVPGVFVTKVDIFLNKAPRSAAKGGTDAAIPIQLQIRNVDAGVPERDAISEQHTVYVTADAAYDVVSGIADKENLADVLAAPVTFEFEEPVYLRSGDEYAIVLLAETDNYEAFVASTYDLVLGSTSKRVSKQPAKGSLFLSQNGSTWTPKQNQDMAYRIYTAKFKSAGNANFINQPLERHLHNYDTSLSVDSDDMSRMRVDHIGHGLGAGDKVQLTGLDSATTYFGLTGAQIMDSAAQRLRVVDPDVNGYYVSMLNGSFTSKGAFGDNAVQTNRGFNADRAILNFSDIVPERTSIEYGASFISGVSHANIALTSTNDPRFAVDANTTLIANLDEHYFTDPKYVANAFAEDSAIPSSGPSIVVGTTISTEQTSSFGGTLAASAKASGFVSDVSPIIDTQSIGMVVTNNVVDNQPLDSAAAGPGENRPANYVPETHPTAGTSPSKHITKIVQLEAAANGIKVLLDMYKPPAADFELYYRTAETSDIDMYELDWIHATPQNSPPDAITAFSDDDVEFSEYRYLIGGEEGTLPDFTAFQLKVVLKSTNTCQAPMINSIRAIALI